MFEEHVVESVKLNEEISKLKAAVVDRDERLLASQEEHKQVLAQELERLAAAAADTMRARLDEAVKDTTARLMETTAADLAELKVSMEAVCRILFYF